MTDTVLPAIPDDYAETRASLHRVATHVLARKRYLVCGRFGLRVLPGGFGTPLFGAGEHEELLRVSGSSLIHERQDADGPLTAVVPLDRTPLAALAAAVGVDLDPTFSVGKDTPDLGDIDTPLTVDSGAVAVMAGFLAIAACALDRTVEAMGADAHPVIAQVWPEHFDLGLDVEVGGRRVNLGASVGDGHHAAPYVYVGPWSSDRPGDPEYWNIGFGALLGYDAVAATGDAVAAVVDFFARGLRLLA